VTDTAAEGGAYGFVGLGQIGSLMAAHLVGDPGGLVVYDLRAEAMDPFVAKGARAAVSVADVGRSAGLVSVMVLDDAQVRDVVAELLPVMSPGSTIVVHSTIRPETAEELAARGRVVGISVLDAPVSGSVAGARRGDLALLVGGDAGAFEIVRERVVPFAGLVVHFGPAGAGTRAKLARNLVHFVSFAAVAEAQRLAEASGIDLVDLGRVVRHSDAVTGGPGAIMFRADTAPLGVDDPLRPIMEHAFSLGEKDLRLALDLAGELDLDLPFARLALARLAPGLGLG
jgi:3-hydroxyisobutyrate dehydrogenase-like beta-hydroxyacid dehydrogenase